MPVSDAQLAEASAPLTGAISFRDLEATSTETSSGVVEFVKNSRRVPSGLHFGWPSTTEYAPPVSVRSVEF